jgi:hypothetical protein
MEKKFNYWIFFTNRKDRNEKFQDFEKISILLGFYLNVFLQLRYGLSTDSLSTPSLSTAGLSTASLSTAGLSTASLSTDRFIDKTLDRQVHFIDMTVLSKLLFLSLFTYRNTYPVGAIQT